MDDLYIGKILFFIIITKIIIIKFSVIYFEFEIQGNIFFILLLLISKLLFEL